MKTRNMIMTVVLVATMLTCNFAYAEQSTDSGELNLTGAEQAPVIKAEKYRLTKRKLSIGFTLDLLPVVLSATAKEFGMTGQVWVGIDHIRLRLVGGRISMPNWLVAKDGFRDQRTTVSAFLIDYVFGDDMDGWWVGTGFELWQNSISHEASLGKRVRFNNLLWTVGGGYIFKVAGNFFIEPWAAAHVIINNHSVEMNGQSFKPMIVSGEISLKIGYSFDL